MQTNLRLLKDTLLIPEVWQKLGLPGAPGKSCRSPFRPDHRPSFSIHEGGRRWKDFATGEGGDVIDFIAAAQSLDLPEATRRFLALADAHAAPTPSSASLPPHARFRLKTHAAAHGAPTPPSASPPLPGPLNPGGPLRRGSAANLETIARTRHLDPAAVSLAQGLGTLAFTQVCGFPCWLLGDRARRIVEARRMDGLPFPAIGPLGERKAHTLRGSHKDWPVGTAVLGHLPAFRAVMLVEGGPDYLAALHFAIQFERWDILPIAMLGRSAGTRIAPEALALIAGRPVCLYPHEDADGGGLTSAEAWATQLHTHGSPVQIYRFADLHQTDGRPVKDLNDLVHLHPDEAHHLENLLP